MTTSPKTEYTQEVRFAVIMYGGVSLAIYINGIAQELLRLVRATSRPMPRLAPVRSNVRRGWFVCEFGMPFLDWF